MKKCPVYKEPCREHGFVHGAEAEELRAGIEEIADSSENADSETIVRRLLNLLDKVDARDSLAYREAVDK